MVEVEEKPESSSIAGVNIKWCSVWKTVWQFFKMFKVELPYDSAIPVLIVYPRELKICPPQNLYTNVHIKIIHNSQSGNSLNDHPLINV